MRPASVASNETACSAGPAGARRPRPPRPAAPARLAAALAAVASLAAPRGAALAADGDACVSAYEGAQEARRAGRVLRARSELRLCQRSCPGALANDCAAWLPDVEARVASLRLQLRGPGGRPAPAARVLVDRQPLPEGAALAAPWELDPGPHALLVEAPGAAPVRRTFVLRNGEKLALPLALTPAAPGPPAAPPVPASAYAVGAAGAFALGAGAFLGVKGHLDKAALRDRCAPFCDQREVDAVATKWTAGAVIAGAGTLALGAALWLALAPPDGAPARGAAPSPRLGWTPGGPLVRF